MNHSSEIFEKGNDHSTVITFDLDFGNITSWFEVSAVSISAWFRKLGHFEQAKEQMGDDKLQITQCNYNPDISYSTLTFFLLLLVFDVQFLDISDQIGHDDLWYVLNQIVTLLANY